MSQTARVSFSRWVLKGVRNFFGGIRLPKTDRGRRDASSVSIFILYGIASMGLLSTHIPVVMVGGFVCGGISVLAWVYTLLED